MKSKIFLVAILFALTLQASAQTEKGKIIIGGSLNFASEDKNGESPRKTRTVNIGPTIGLFVSKNFAVGAGLRYHYGKSDPIIENYFDGINYQTTVTHGSRDRSFGVMPFARYYVDIVEHFKLFGQVSFSADFGKQKDIDGTFVETPSYNYKIYTAAVNPGFAVFPTKKLAIELSFPLVNYFSQKYEFLNPANEATFNYLTFALTTSPTLGINFHF